MLCIEFLHRAFFQRIHSIQDVYHLIYRTRIAVRSEVFGTVPFYQASLCKTREILLYSHLYIRICLVIAKKHDNIFLMLEPQISSIRNILKGKIVEMKLEHEIIRVKIDVGGTILCSDITVSAEKELNLNIGKEVYIGFKAMSVATLKL